MIPMKNKWAISTTMMSKTCLGAYLTSVEEPFAKIVNDV